jgi:hypothetical protein
MNEITRHYALYLAISKMVNYHAILRINTRGITHYKNSIQKIIRFDSNIGKINYLHFFRVNWCLNGIKWRKTLNFKIHINDIITRK